MMLSALVELTHVSVGIAGRFPYDHMLWLPRWIRRTRTQITQQVIWNSDIHEADVRFATFDALPVACVGRTSCFA